MPTWVINMLVEGTACVKAKRGIKALPDQKEACGRS